MTVGMDMIVFGGIVNGQRVNEVYRRFRDSSMIIQGDEERCVLISDFSTTSPKVLMNIGDENTRHSAQSTKLTLKISILSVVRLPSTYEHA